MPQRTPPTHGACELRRNLASALLAVTLLVFAAPAFASASALGFSVELRRDHAVAAYGSEGGQEHPASQAEAARGHEAAAEHHEESLGGMFAKMAWPVANFIIFLGVIYHFGNKPFSEYLATRGASIRKDLVEAAELKSAATTQLAQIEQKLQALPREIASLRTRGSEEITSEEQRIASAAAADRERMLEQARREIELQVRLAKKEILEHAADLSVQLATDRIKKEVTPADQDRLVDRYLQQVKEN